MTSFASFVASENQSASATSKTVRNIVLNVDVLKSLKLFTYDQVAIAKDPSSFQAPYGRLPLVIPNVRFHGVPLHAPLVNHPEAVHLSPSTLLSGCMLPGDKVYVVPLSPSPPTGLPDLSSIQEARSIQVRCSPSRKSGSLFSLLVRECLVNLKYIHLSQAFDVPFEGTTFQITVMSVDGSDSDGSQLPDLQSLSLHLQSTRKFWTCGWNSNVVVIPPTKELSTSPGHTTSPQISKSKPDPYASVGGLSKQISQIRDLLEIPLTRPELFRRLGLKPPRGILLHGPPGTGKTHLARAIASSTASSVLVINGPELSSAYHGETESKLRDVFREAREKSPCIVVLDEVDALAPKREESGGGGEVEKRVVATLLTILDGMHDDENNDVGSAAASVVVIGTTNRPNAIDPALRRPGRFDKEIEIGVPDAEARFSILLVLLSQSVHDISLQDLHAFAGAAHGYVGADLSAVVREAGIAAIKRYTLTTQADDKSNDISTPDSVPSSSPKLAITLEDLTMVLPTIRPSAMRSLFIETPRIRYSDIGGQAEVIRKLKESVEWPLLHPDAFARLGVKPPKGVLLYGPPGCSKTVLARACACESGVNFLAVKGPELLNKFVGESERAVREIFGKARAAAPSIVFFDEIDALGSSRSLSEGAIHHEGVLTSLLNEMDGVQELVGVTIIAATNRPEVMDSALMRPGRLDRLLFVGPPDQTAREEILTIRLREMKVSPDVNISELAQLCRGCSGAEITAICQEAAYMAMQKDINTPFIPYESFCNAAKKTKRQITPEVLAKFEVWRARQE